MSGFKETELWRDARMLVREAYRVTESWPDDGSGRGLADEIRVSARAIAKMVPSALRKQPGPGGRPMWMYSMHSFTDLEVVTALAADLDLTDETATKEMLALAETIRSQMKALAKEVRDAAQAKRSKMFGMDMFDDDFED